MTMGEVGWAEPASGSTVTAAALTEPSVGHRNPLDLRVAVGFGLEGHRGHRPAVLDEPELVGPARRHRLEPVAVDDGAVLLAVPEELDAGVRIAAGGELEQLDAGLQDRVERRFPLGQPLLGLRQRPDRARPARSRPPPAGPGPTPAHARGRPPGAGWPRAPSHGTRRPAGWSSRSWRPGACAAAIARSSPRRSAPARARGAPRRARLASLAKRQQRGHLAVLRHLALRLRRRGEEGLEPRAPRRASSAPSA